jgi:hypothetical protein
VLDTNISDSKLRDGSSEGGRGEESSIGETTLLLIMLSPADEAEEIEVVKKKIAALTSTTRSKLAHI